MSRLPRPPFLLVLALLASGCSHHAPAGAPTPGDPSEVGIQVENQNASSLTAYLESSGVSRRLGLVNTAETRSYVVPWSEVGTGVLRLRGEILGSNARVVTDEIRVRPGQVVRWTVTARLAMSGVVLY
jgi:hypothetical protein